MPKQLLLALPLLLLGACGGPSLYQVSMHDYDGAWPFTVPDGELICRYNADNGNPMVTLEHDGVEYALNGGAEQGVDRFGFRPMTEIYRVDDNGLRVNPSNNFIQLGLERCN